MTDSEKLHFSAQRFPQTGPLAQSAGSKLTEALSEAIKQSPLSREEIARRMTLLIYGSAGDSKISKAMLDSWTSRSRAAWRFPLEYLPAFVQVTGSFAPLAFAAERCGCRLLIGEEALLAQLGVIEMEKWLLNAREKAVKHELTIDLANRVLSHPGGPE